MKNKANRKKGNVKNRVFKIITLFLMLVIVAVITVLVYFNVAYSQKIFPNITINDKNYSGLTKKQAFEKLENEIKSTYQNGFVFQYEDKIYDTDFLETRLAIDVSKTIDAAFAYGHQKNILQNLKEQSKLIYLKNDFSIETSFDKVALENYLANEISKIETPPKNFGYFYNNENEEFIPTQSKTGMIINQEKIVKDILNNLRILENKVIEIELVKKYPEFTKDFNDVALMEAENLLTKKIILQYNSKEWEVAKEDFVLWFSFSAIKNSSGSRFGLKIDQEKTEKYLISLVPQVNKEPVNAQLKFNKDDRVDIFSLSQEGLVLQIKKSAAEISEKVFTKENYQNNLETEIIIPLITEKTQPEITTEDIGNMGITALLATGESNFYGSPKNRKHNIMVGASRFHGVLIGPKDEFSFNTALGKVGAKQGYLPELVIKKDKTVPEYGGGLCQVSTTAFRGAVKAGFEITERENHAYPVQYYNPQGTDATIYPPHPDLRFKNNTPAYVLIQTRIEGNKLYFDFYGSDDGREVTLKGPYTYDWKPDGSMKTTWTQEVYNKDGELQFKKIFYSNYKSPALYPH